MPSPDAWVVVPSRKKGGKSKQKHAAVPKSPTIESPSKMEARTQEILYDSPSVRSVRSVISTNDELGSLPSSPNMVSSWSDTSTDETACVLDDAAVTEDSCSRSSSPAPEHPEPLGSEWSHNGHQGEAAEWRLILLQPRWSNSSPDVPHVPVPVEAVDSGLRLVMRRTFLNLELTDSTPRSHSLEPRLRGKPTAL